MPFSALQPLVDPAPGGGLWLFLITLVAFVGAAGWGVFGPNRGTPDGSATAILDLRLAFATRIAIHCFFLAALLYLGLATSQPVIFAVAIALLAAELPIGILTVHRRQVGARSASIAGRRVGGVTPA